MKIGLKQLILAASTLPAEQALGVLKAIDVLDEWNSLEVSNDEETKDADKWIAHTGVTSITGFDLPAGLEADDVVKVKFRNGQTSIVNDAGKLSWVVYGDQDFDIVEYMVIE